MERIPTDPLANILIPEIDSKNVPSIKFTEEEEGQFVLDACFSDNPNEQEVQSIRGMEDTGVTTEPTDEMLTSEIEFVEHPIKLDPEELACFQSEMEVTEVTTEPTDELMTSKIEIEEHPIKLEPEKLDCLQNGACDMDDLEGSFIPVQAVYGVPQKVQDQAALQELRLDYTFGDNTEDVTDSDTETDEIKKLESALPSTSQKSTHAEHQESAKRNEIKRINKSSNNKVLNKMKRARGEEYESYSRLEGKNVKRAAKCCGDQCQLPVCTEKRRTCVTMSSKGREQYFSKFWELTTIEKQVYIKALVDCVEPKSRRGDPILSTPRSSQNLYFLNVNGTREQVCKDFFLKVHGIGDGQMRSWLHKDLPPNADQTLKPSNSATTRTKNRPDLESFKNSYAYYSAKLDELPTVESLFGGEDYKKKFVDKECQSILHLYGVITKHAEEEGVDKLSWAKFHEMFKQKNLAIHKPKKDLCDSCCKYNFLVKAGSVTEEEARYHQEHAADVISMRNEKAKDKKLSVEDHLVLVVDGEKMLPLPKLNNSNQYYLYLQKLQLKNYITFDLQTNAVLCYMIIEFEGGSDASIFASLQRDVIRKKKMSNPKILYVIIYSDSQNLNATLSNALLDLAIQLNITIVQKFLIPGHSQNEADIVHSSIENAVRNKELYSLEEYVAAVEGMKRDEASSGRAGATAYQVELVSHMKFENLENCKFYSSICPEQGPGTSLYQLRAIKYTPEGTIFYKLKISEEWTPMPHKLSQPSTNISSKYTEQIPISAAKYRDLQKLKSFVPAEHHQFYEQIPHL